MPNRAPQTTDSYKARFSPLSFLPPPPGFASLWEKGHNHTSNKDCKKVHANRNSSDTNGNADGTGSTTIWPTRSPPAVYALGAPSSRSNSDDREFERPPIDIPGERPSVVAPPRRNAAEIMPLLWRKKTDDFVTPEMDDKSTRGSGSLSANGSDSGSDCNVDDLIECRDFKDYNDFLNTDHPDNTVGANKHESISSSYTGDTNGIAIDNGVGDQSNVYLHLHMPTDSCTACITKNPWTGEIVVRCTNTLTESNSKTQPHTPTVTTLPDPAVISPPAPVTPVGAPRSYLGVLVSNDTTKTTDESSQNAVEPSSKSPVTSPASQNGNEWKVVKGKKSSGHVEVDIKTTTRNPYSVLCDGLMSDNLNPHKTFVGIKQQTPTKPPSSNPASTHKSATSTDVKEMHRQWLLDSKQRLSPAQHAHQSHRVSNALEMHRQAVERLEQVMEVLDLTRDAVNNRYNSSNNNNSQQHRHHDNGAKSNFCNYQRTHHNNSSTNKDYFYPRKY